MVKNPKIKTMVVHSQTKSAWNVIGQSLGGKYKICRVPYLVMDNQELSDRNRQEAFEHANFINHCFNNSDVICSSLAQIISAKMAAQQQLIQLLYSQVVDLTMMSKIELGDDVIAEIIRLKSLINE